MPGVGKLILLQIQGFRFGNSRVRQDTFAEQVKVRQENTTATWGSARSALSVEFLSFRKIILLNLLWGDASAIFKQHSGNCQTSSAMTVATCEHFSGTSSTHQRKFRSSRHLCANFIFYCRLTVSERISERLFQGITREIRSFSNFFILESFFVGNKFVSEHITQFI